jgi:hypothetical protein
LATVCDPVKTAPGQTVSEDALGMPINADEKPARNMDKQRKIP